LGIFEKIKDAFRETDLVQDLVDHLGQIGVRARVIDAKSVEAVKHKATLGIFGNPPLGVVKIDGRNIDVVELYREVRGGGGGGVGPGGHGYHQHAPSEVFYYYDYVVRGAVGEREDDLKAEVHPIEKGFLHKELVDFEWKGGKLAESLNADRDLRKMILDGGAPHLTVKPDKKDECVAIKMPHGGWHTTVTVGGIPIRHEFAIGRKAFPSHEAFEIYDRIAMHIRSETGAHN
jgi:hypothetical protein